MGPGGGPPGGGGGPWAPPPPPFYNSARTCAGDGVSGPQCLLTPAAVPLPRVRPPPPRTPLHTHWVPPGVLRGRCSCELHDCRADFACVVPCRSRDTTWHPGRPHPVVLPPAPACPPATARNPDMVRRWHVCTCVCLLGAFISRPVIPPHCQLHSHPHPCPSLTLLHTWHRLRAGAPFCSDGPSVCAARGPPPAPARGPWDVPAQAFPGQRLPSGAAPPPRCSAGGDEGDDVGAAGGVLAPGFATARQQFWRDELERKRGGGGGGGGGGVGMRGGSLAGRGGAGGGPMGGPRPVLGRGRAADEGDDDPRDRAPVYHLGPDPMAAKRNKVLGAKRKMPPPQGASAGGPSCVQPARCGCPSFFCWPPHLLVTPPPVSSGAPPCPPARDGAFACPCVFSAACACEPDGGVPCAGRAVPALLDHLLYVDVKNRTQRTTAMHRTCLSSCGIWSRL
jgi:hypothetical protein